MSEKEKSNKFSRGGVNPSRKIWKKWWFWALIVAVLIGGVIEYTEPEKEETINDTTETETTTEPIVTTEPEIKENAATEEPTAEKESNEEKQDISAYELVTMEGHPVLYDYLSTAHTFWDSYAEKRIDFPDDYFDDFQSGKTALVIDAWLSLERDLDEHMIRAFEIYPNKEITLDEGLNLAKTYIPLDILGKWYEISQSEKYYFEKENRYRYSILYVPTEEGKGEIEKSGIDYNYIKVMINVENEIVTAIQIFSTNETPNLGHDYEVQEWNFDFLN